jgi:hypothetical protein
MKRNIHVDMSLGEHLLVFQNDRTAHRPSLRFENVICRSGERRSPFLFLGGINVRRSESSMVSTLAAARAV